LYSGYFFKIIKKAIRDGEFDERIDICILSAEHGIIDAETEVGWYDRRMDAERARELAPEVRASLRETVRDTHDTVIVNVGGVYTDALGAIDEYVSSDIFRVEGDGIGQKGHVLKNLIRTDSRVESADAPLTGP
jgi:hypothetical protein